MGHKGASAYDQERFFESFLARRNRSESPNNIIEKPVLLELLDPVVGKRVVDLGCGDGLFGCDLKERGASYYEGVEGSRNMVQKAEGNLGESNVAIVHTPIEEWQSRKESFDIVVSRMVFHYIENLPLVFRKVYESMKEGGQFVFSVQHPVLTSSMESAAKSGKRSSWLVDDYFRSGERQEPWLEEEVTKYHRTMEQYFQLIKQAGFAVEDLRECEPRREYFKKDEEYDRRQRIPLFLLFACRKS
ncbi:class I SAM-dependent methyltransferase [Halobacillus locisalis]|uniref:Class I SAM-dependent methyltransferase n=2 Tax=Halobacillus locisalis TaxID=220753 RepID=A0A838CNI5_9BACI|nr:class I SAM-dependent methyltransferase [Halobacillus locisalis]